MSGFDWEHIYSELDWLPGGALNAAHEAIDRHAQGPRRDKVAMVWEGKNGEREDYTFGQMSELSDRFANVLKSLGVEKGDRVFLYMDRVPELYIAVFGTLKAAAIAGPMSPAFGPDPVRVRMKDSRAKILVTQPHLRRRISGIVYELFELQHIVVVNKNERDPWPMDSADLDYYEEMAKAPASFPIVPTSPDDPSLMRYTPSITGSAKGALHRHRAVVQQYATGKWVLDLHGDDVYWCTAGPGCATGTSYGMLAPWTNGVTQLIYEGGFGVTAWYRQLQEHKITVWYTAPTAIRMLMKAGDQLPKRYDLSSLRHIVSVGEPLSPDTEMWTASVLKKTNHGGWSQAETGAVLIANYPAMDIRPGSMGKPTPGVEAAILDQDYNRAPTGTVGALAIRSGWPSMFQTYWNDAGSYDSRFQQGWYMTGDRARIDEDGYLWFEARSDDVIHKAGRLVGPTEVERALVQHPAVAQARAFGVPHPIAGQVVKASVVLGEGFEPTSELRREIMRFARRQLGTALAPREIEFSTS